MGTKKVQDIKKGNNTSPKKKHLFIKVLVVILIIYLAISLYKFIALTVMNNIGNSFSEESYEIMFNHKSDNGTEEGSITTHSNYLKIKEKAVEKTYSGDAEKPDHITYIDMDKKERYDISYNQEDEKYILDSDNNVFTTDEEKENYYEEYKNLESFKLHAGVNKNKLGYRINMALNPFIRVNIFSKKVVVHIPFNYKVAYEYNDDYLLTRVRIDNYNLKNSFEDNISYDYVPEHFNNREIKNPMEEYKVEKNNEKNEISKSNI